MMCPSDGMLWLRTAMLESSQYMQATKETTRPPHHLHAQVPMHEYEQPRGHIGWPLDHNGESSGCGTCGLVSSFARRKNPRRNSAA